MATTRRKFLRAAAFGALAAPTMARAQTPAWPSRPVRVIVPVAAGTATDLTARIFGEKLSALWGQPFVVENRPGADGLVAIGGFVSARDDHTLLFSFSTAVSLNPLIHAKLPYDPAVDLVPITTTSEVLFGIAVHDAVPAKTIQDLAAHVREILQSTVIRALDPDYDAQGRVRELEVFGEFLRLGVVLEGPDAAGVVVAVNVEAA